MTGAIVGRFVLEVSADTRETALEAETALLPVLQGDSLQALLEECLDELPEIAEPVWIDEFAVDLGRLPLATDQDDLRRHAKAAIREQLELRVAETRRSGSEGMPGAGMVASPPSSSLSVLARFLARGVIHWSHTAPVDVAALVDDAAAQDLPGTRALLRSAMADPHQAQRLATHLSPEQIVRLSVVVAPQAGGLLARLHRVFVDLHGELPLTDRAAPDVLAAANRALLEAGTRLGSVWISEARVADEFAGSIARNLRLDPDSLKAGMVARLRDPRRPQDVAGAEAEALLRRAGDDQMRESLLTAAQAREGAAAADSIDMPGDHDAMATGQQRLDADAVAYFLRTGLPLALEDAGPRRLIEQSRLRRALLSWLLREGQSGLVWQALRHRLGAVANMDRALVLTRLQMLLPPAEARRVFQRLGYAPAESGSPGAGDDQRRGNLLPAGQAREGSNAADSRNMPGDHDATATGQQRLDADAVAYFLRTGLPLAPEDAGPRRLIERSRLRRALLSWLPREGQSGLVWQALRQRLGAVANMDRALVLTRLQMLLPPDEARRVLQRLGYAPAESSSPGAAPDPPESQDDNIVRSEDVLRAGEVNRDLEIFWYLMEFGALPWWGREVIEGSVDQWTRGFTMHQASQIAGLLKTMTENRRALLVERMGARLALEPIAWIVGAARPALKQEAADWLKRLPDAHRFLTANAGDWASDGEPVPAAGQWLRAMAATLIARLFDPHAPERDWPELQREVARSVARRLRLPEEALLRAFADAGLDAAPVIQEWNEQEAGGREPGEQDPDEGLLPPIGSDAPPEPQPGQTGDAALQTESDVELLARFISPTGQLTVSLADIRAILADEQRRRPAVSRLSAAQVDGLADRLAPGEPLLRVSSLLPLEDALQQVDPAWDAALWRRELMEGVAATLSDIVAGQSGRAATAAGLLHSLLRRRAVRLQQELPAYIGVVNDAASAHGTVQPAVLATLNLLAEEAAPRSTGERGMLPEAEAPDLPPSAREDRPTHSTPERRFGQPAGQQVSEAETVRRYLASTDTGAVAEALEASVRAMLAEPVGRAAIAAGLTVQELDRLGQRLGITPASLLPSDVRALDGLLTAAVPGGGGSAWIVDMVGAVLAEWSRRGGEPRPGIVPQVRRMVLAFARTEAADYHAILQTMAGEVTGGKSAASPSLADAITQLASTAAADAPVQDAESTARDPGYPDLENDADQVVGSSPTAVESGPPEQAQEPGISPVTDRPPGAQTGSEARAGPLTESPSIAADWPLHETGSLELADRRLFDAAAAGSAEAKAEVRALLLAPAYRARLSNRIDPADLDRLAVALLNITGPVETSGLLGLGPLVAATTARISAAAWRRAVAGEVLRLIADEPFFPSSSAFYRLVLTGAAAALNLDGDAASTWAKQLLEAEGTGGVRISVTVRQTLETMSDASGSLVDAEDESALAEAFAHESENLGALTEEPLVPTGEAVGLPQRLLEGDQAVAAEFQAAMRVQARRRTTAARLSPALLDRLGAVLLRWVSAPRPSEIISLGPLVAQETRQISPAAWREIVADQVLILVAEGETGPVDSAAMRLVLQRSLHAVAGSDHAVSYLAIGLVESMFGAGVSTSEALADALLQMASRTDMRPDTEIGTSPDASGGDEVGGDTASAEAIGTPAAGWRYLPLPVLAELFLAQGDAGGSGEVMAGVLARQLLELAALRSLRDAFPQGTLSRLSAMLSAMGADVASLELSRQDRAAEAQPPAGVALPPAGVVLPPAGVVLPPAGEARQSAGEPQPPAGERQYEDGPMPVPDQGRYWLTCSFHALPVLAKTLIALPRTVPPFREVAETVWVGLFAGQETVRAQDFVSPQTLRTAARILRQAGYSVADAEGLWTGQAPAADAPAVPPAEEWSLEALAGALLAEPLTTQTRPAAERVWHGLSARAGRAVMTAAFSLADRTELVRILVAAGYPLNLQQRAGLGVLDGVGPGADAASAKGADAGAETGGGDGERRPDQTLADASPNAGRDTGQQSVSRRREPDVWPWQEEDEGGSDWARELLFVQDAGAVLLWPFLVHYFDRVGLLEEGRFASEEAAARGVMLIHYLATAGTATEEPQLVLPKLLCGVPFETPVAPRIDLTEMEETVSDELLNVVCQNWPPLRNSSVEALRETFLLREGSLSWLEERIWVLNVTAKPYDMLLGQLPWTLSTFKTPLMQHPMMVQWGQQ